MVQDIRDQEEFSTMGRANLLGIPYADSRELIKEPLLENIIPIPDMYEDKVVPLKKNHGSLTFGICVSTPQQTAPKIRQKFQDLNVSFLMISDTGYREFMRKFDPPKEVVYEDIAIASQDDVDAISSISRTLESVKSDDILDYLITQADRLNASDVHFETERDYVRMRMRVDGVLHPVARLSREKYRQLQSSIAIKANISTDAPEAQTGHMTHDLVGKDGKPYILNMRIETVPTNFGQDAVVRLLSLDTEILDLGRLGLSDIQRKIVQDAISRSQGMVLLVGPTGSGKTTTLYSMLKELDRPDRKIITLEDPVEYAFEGVSQIPVNSRSGDTFANKLRAVLRLDPDVVMVGEIRDVDTARTALQAALTGHLVLSTFHAASAPAALSRMREMIGDNPLFSSAISLIIAQRLVRVLDDTTKQSYTPDELLKNKIIEAVSSLPEGYEQPNLDNLVLYNPGKSAENPFGYKGRTMLLEQLRITPSIRQALRDPVKSMSTDELEKAAKNDGMVSMHQDGILKAIAGTTTVEEVFKVTG